MQENKTAGQYAAPQIELQRVVRFHRFALVKPSKVEFSPTTVGTASAMFTPAEMRHNFAIWAVNKDASVKPQRHLYYCLRCKEAFSVDDHSGSVTPLDPRGRPVLGKEAVTRLATFGQGPCPAFSRLTWDRHLTRRVIPIWAVSGGLRRMILAAAQTWKASIARSYQLLVRGKVQNQRRNRRHSGS